MIYISIKCTQSMYDLFIFSDGGMSEPNYFFFHSTLEGKLDEANWLKNIQQHPGSGLPCNWKHLQLIQDKVADLVKLLVEKNLKLTSSI